MTAQVIPIAPYIERRALRQVQDYTPAQFMQEVTFHWLEFLLAMAHGTASADNTKRP